MPYVYRHIRLDKNQPFYIGIGKEDNGIFTRAYSHKNRNTYWNNIDCYYYWTIIISYFIEF